MSWGQSRNGSWRRAQKDEKDTSRQRHRIMLGIDVNMPATVPDSLFIHLTNVYWEPTVHP